MGPGRTAGEEAECAYIQILICGEGRFPPLVTSNLQNTDDW